jgi:hypothetical protein
MHVVDEGLIFPIPGPPGPAGPAGPPGTNAVIPVQDFGAVPGGIADASDGIQAALDAAGSRTTSRDGPWVQVDLQGQAYGLSRPLDMSAIHKTKIVNGRLEPIASFGDIDDPLVQFGDGTSGGTPYFSGLRDVHLECKHLTSGVLSNGSIAHHHVGLKVHGQASYGYKTTFNSGAGVCERCHINEYWSNESGMNFIANRKAVGFDIGVADDIFIGCISSYCKIPLRLTGGPTQWAACHFFNGATDDGVDNLIIEKSGNGSTQFVGCYMDNGLIRMIDLFRVQFDGCIFIKNANGNQESFFDLVTSVAGSDGAGFGCVGGEFRFPTLANDIIKYSTTGSGSWLPDLKISWSANRRADTSDVVYKLSQMMDQFVVDELGRTLLGTTRSRALATLQARLQAVGATETLAAMATLKYGADANGPWHVLAKSRGANADALAAVTTTDRLGTLAFAGDDGVDRNAIGASVLARAAAPWSASDHSTELILATRGTAGLTFATTLTKDGHWNPWTTNTFDLGQATKAWRNVFGTSINTGNGDAQWLSGTGSPEGVVTAKVGSLYSRLDGGAATTLYVKQTGTGNTGWAAK